MMFIYLFIAALAAVVAGWFLRFAYDEVSIIGLRNEVDEQLKKILKLEKELEQWKHFANAKDMWIDQLEAKEKE